MLILKTLTPLDIRELIALGLLDFGPRVAIILVLFNF